MSRADSVTRLILAMLPAAAIAGLASCASSEPATTGRGLDRASLLAAEYRQLTHQESFFFGVFGSATFARKAEAAARGEQVLPEDPIDWDNDITVVAADGPRQDPPTKLSVYRTEIVTNICRLDYQVLPTGSWADLPAAEAHAQGRLDCLIARAGRHSGNDTVAATCAREFSRSVFYVRDAAAALKPDKGRCKTVHRNRA